jgi:hypothetical protein
MLGSKNSTQRCIARQHSPIFATIFGNVKVDMVDNFK